MQFISTKHTPPIPPTLSSIYLHNTVILYVSTGPEKKRNPGRWRRDGKCQLKELKFSRDNLINKLIHDFLLIWTLSLTLLNVQISHHTYFNPTDMREKEKDEGPHHQAVSCEIFFKLD